ncbi:MAG: hypothetical protein AMS27_01975 [Bacteroides sp. SM23_62_1]|nr:MAG: hypothetical protein AMS27_01975 [Bacteroides sp. SM23_62_1]
MMNEIITSDLKQAVKDFSYLIENQYPRKTILKIISDRYLLNKTQRVLLGRGIFKKDEVEQRVRKRTESIRDKLVYIDTYNVLFILSNYLLGRIVFIGNDGFIRDAGEVYGKLHREKVFLEAIGYLLDYLGYTIPAQTIFLIDSPVSFSGELAIELKNLLIEKKVSGDARTIHNPDAEMIKISEGIVATSDSEILDESACQLCDLPYLILNSRFSPELPDLRKIRG